MSDSSETGRRKLAAVVYNPVKVELDDLRPVVEAEERAAGWEPSLWYETSEDDAGGGQARQALDAGATMVLAAGGDGTVREVAEALQGTHASLALLPSGTGNLLARNLSLTLNDMEHSVHAAFSGGDRSIDAGLIDIRRADGGHSKHAFLVMAGFGIDAKMLSATDDDLKAKVGWLAYVKAFATVLRGDNLLRARFSLDGGEVRHMRVNTVIVGNAGSLPGNILLLPEAAVDDGQLDVVILRPEELVGWIQVFVKVLWENGVVRRTKLGRRFREREVKSINYLRGQEFRVRLDHPQEIELDGDPLGKALGMVVTVAPGALTVRVPADVAEEGEQEGSSLAEADSTSS
ncbi:diacylglycerol/lipid kinase family protein [Amnibacterium kyonggiense]|uniref:Diacylglycerol kinase family enzyme n=1 Tax=Amnibacterium kyonggiense TaxID=595671 RepID=A0A4R7FLF5_9MICO|nr:diacylglycerol kinase family protein [Amnibacterium kyonggiense]TDS77213.1 diacylglycerol kinase family enzyme [Amnibacterium kyonggiense]